MNIKSLFISLLKYIYNYNLFIPDEDDYDDDDSDEIRDPAIILKHQLYSTRLYIPLFISKHNIHSDSLTCTILNFLLAILYILTFIAVISPQNQSFIISNITPELFMQLSNEHGDTLSCPCSTIAVLYKTFVTNTISFHPICSSIYVSKEWIQALYISYASSLLVMDFRTTAKSQVNQYY